MASEYEALVEDVALCCDCSLTEARAAIALIAERTKEATPGMLKAWNKAPASSDHPGAVDWSAMHAVSPLWPPRDGKKDEEKRG